MKIHNVDQRSDEWYSLRIGVPTASDFSRAITPKKGDMSIQGIEYAAELALELFTGQPNEDFGGTEWMDRGAGLEDEAIAQYEMLYDVDVERVGFITSDDGNRGCSPDGLVGDDGMIEVKCLKDKNHVKSLLKHVEYNEVDPKYTPQTQGQMMIAERGWCDLLFYCPGMPLLPIRQYPDDKYGTNLDSALNEIIRLRDRALAILTGTDERKAA
jgi:hypothetical protein